MKRLVDGSTAEVPAGYELTASVDHDSELEATRRATGRPLWMSNLQEDATCGTWISDMEALAKKLKTAVRDGRLSRVEAMKKYKQAAVLKQAEGRLRAAPMLIGEGKIAGQPAKRHLIVLSVARDRTVPVPLTPSEAEAQVRFAEAYAKSKQQERKKNRPKPPSELKALGAELMEQVKQGELTEEEAKARWIRAKRAAGSKGKDRSNARAGADVRSRGAK